MASAVGTFGPELAEIIELRDAITERMDCGASLDEVEAELIESQEDLDEEEKAALWLFAWSSLPLVRPRSTA